MADAQTDNPWPDDLEGWVAFVQPAGLLPSGFIFVACMFVTGDLRLREAGDW
jgi:hypothetical protein